MESDPDEIIEIYRKRWEIELLFKQIKQNFPLSFSGLATMMRITLMYYVDFYSLFNHPEKDWETLLNVKQKEDYQLSIF